MHYDQGVLRDLGTAPRAKVGPNEPCWCGSGKKYKRCHRDVDAEAARTGSPTRRAKLLEPGVVGPKRPVPAEIPRPDYADTGRPGPISLPEVKDAGRVARMRKACRIAAEVLEKTAAWIRPGVTTDELDAICHEECLRRGAYPSPLNYRGFPKSLCTSVNEVICHGIPDDRPLEEGDIIDLDVTVYVDGMHGDTNATYFVGAVDPASQRLVEVTRKACELGIAAVKPGGMVRDIGRAIEAHAKAHDLSVVRTYCGHGIGEVFHSRLQIPHYFDPRATTQFVPGMTFTIEPMINEGTWRDRLWADGWTVVTADGRRSAQFEHTVLVTESGVEILTLPGSG
ncbi:MAG: type I methionyl aminopeptidase [Myxococcales bacterium]|nr:type I methionyl aminopeptidase [Myxococcales bacterium]